MSHAAFIAVSRILFQPHGASSSGAPHLDLAGCSHRAGCGTPLPSTGIRSQQLASSHGFSFRFLSAASWELVGALERNLDYFFLLLVNPVISSEQNAFFPFDIITHSLLG